MGSIDPCPCRETIGCPLVINPLSIGGRFGTRSRVAICLRFLDRAPQQVLPLINRSRNRHRRLHTSLFRLCTNTHRNNINPLCTNRHRPLVISRRRNLNLLCTNRHRLRIPIRIRRLIQWTLGSLRSSFRG